MGALAFSLLLFAAPPDEAPKPKLPVGKDTTYVTGPIDKSGYIDYEAALNERLSKGITPDKNAVVLLWKAFGPTPDGAKEAPAEYFRWLGAAEPPKASDYFIDLSRFAKDQNLAFESNELFEHKQHVTRGPWGAKDYPHIAAWLKANEKPLAVILEATKRPEYYDPIVTHRTNGERDFLIGAFPPLGSPCRGAADALAARATLRVSEKKFDDAWSDVLACHRLGRLVGRGATLVELLLGFAIERVAADAALVYLDRADLTAEKALARLKELRDPPPRTHPAETLDFGDRLISLDALQFIHLRGFEVLAKECAPADQLDWEVLLRTMNKWRDRMAAAMRMKDRAAREKEFDAIETKLKDRTKAATDPAELLKKLEDGEALRKEVSARIADILSNLLRPAVRGVQHRFEQAQQTERNLHLAFALAAYHKDTGKYPAKLTDLAPKYLKEVPGDLFSGKALIYKPAEKGYLFYSVGQNGKDDGGRDRDDEPAGDDLPVQMPLPELKKK